MTKQYSDDNFWAQRDKARAEQEDRIKRVSGMSFFLDAAVWSILKYPDNLQRAVDIWTEDKLPDEPAVRAFRQALDKTELRGEELMTALRETLRTSEPSHYFEWFTKVEDKARLALTKVQCRRCGNALRGQAICQRCGKNNQ